MPTNVPFQTLEEIDRYLSGDKLECLVCGRHFSLLNKHLSEKHSLTTFDYRVQFGIPLDRELASAAPRQGAAQAGAILHTQSPGRARHAPRALPNHG